MNEARTTKKSKRGTILAAVGGLIAGGLLFASCGGNADAEAEPAPAVTVTAEPEVETVEVTVEQTPQECLEALNLADASFTISSEIMNAIMNDDVAGMQSGVQELQANVDPYTEAKTACRAAGN